MESSIERGTTRITGARRPSIITLDFYNNTLARLVLCDASFFSLDKCWTFFMSHENNYSNRSKMILCMCIVKVPLL